MSSTKDLDFNSFMNQTYGDSFKAAMAELQELQAQDKLAVATFAGGCFWCMEGPLQETPGVAGVVSGYAGGTEEAPSYDEVASGKTSHFEAVQVFYDPQQVTYEQLLDTYWLQIDPTDEGGQFADRGQQYQTAIFYHTEGQKLAAEISRDELAESGRFEQPIVTEILPFTTFYPAEDYHQDFYKHSAERYKAYEAASGRKDFVEENKQFSTQ